MIDYGTLLRDHVMLRCRSIDRIFLQAYVPRLQTVGEVCTFLRWQRKFPIPSSAAFGRIGNEYLKALYRFAEANGIPVVHFQKGQNKEEVARPYLEAAAKEGKERVVMIGMAQEKASVWRSWPRKGQEKARHPHMDWGREMAFINHFYFYLWDSEWGAAFWKTNAYAPFPIWLWLNGHEWAKRQLDKAGIGYEALTTDSVAAATRLDCRRFAMGSVQPRCKAFSRVGPGVCPRSSPRPTGGPDTDMKWRSASSRFPIPGCSTGRRRAGCGLKE
jgi:hypothetical protein